MRIGRKETKRRLIGFTLPTVLGTGGGGAAFTNEPGDRPRAQSVLNFLENRRVLYDPFQVEIPQRCITSVQDIRWHLPDVIGACDSADLRNPLRAIQAACREFLTEAEMISGKAGHVINVAGGGSDSWLFNQVLGTLRARVGTSVAIIVQTFDIDVDEHLAQIMPPTVDDGETDNPELETR